MDDSSDTHDATDHATASTNKVPVTTEPHKPAHVDPQTQEIKESLDQRAQDHQVPSNSNSQPESQPEFPMVEKLLKCVKDDKFLEVF